MGAAGWLFDDNETQTTYFTESYSMPTSIFALKVSILIGRRVEANYVGGINGQDQVDKLHSLAEGNSKSKRQYVYVSPE